MANDTMHIYRVLHADKTMSYEFRTNNERGSINCPSLGTLARTVRDTAENSVDEIINVDFEPIHEMQICAGLSPRLFVPLSDAEVDEFWKNYIAD